MSVDRISEALLVAVSIENSGTKVVYGYPLSRYLARDTADEVLLRGLRSRVHTHVGMRPTLVYGTYDDEASPFLRFHLRIAQLEHP